MRVITRQGNANTAAARWLRQYKGPTWKYEGKEEIFERLKALGPTPNPDDVDQAIGNGSWTSVGNRDECREPHPVLIEVGETPDYESATAELCHECLSRAATRAKNALEALSK